MRLDVSSFLESSGTAVDVRSPCEYAQGHIQGAINIPLFSDLERKEVGTLYKARGAKEAFALGLEYVSPKLSHMIDAMQKHDARRIYCFRGGMRSGSIADLLKQLGSKVTVLEGGYKAYRQFCMKILEQPFDIHLIGGGTGSGKTDLLKTFPQFIDLEGLACHRGSVFGAMGNQPAQAHFENLIAEKLRGFDPAKAVWIEDESRMIGALKIPDSLFKAMQKAPLYLVERPINERVKSILQSYDHIKLPEFTSLVERLRKRLGNVRTDEILMLAGRDSWEESVELLVNYYDKAYRESIRGRGGVREFSL